MNLRRLSVAALSVAAVLAMGVPASAADSATPALLSKTATSAAELQQQVDLHMRLYPGGTRIGENKISYDGGKFIVTYPQPGSVTTLAGSPNCPDGWFCFYDGPNYTGARGQLSDFGWDDLAKYGWNDRTESIHNNTNTRVEFANWTGDHDDWLVCLHRWTAKPSVSPHGNKLDHTWRSSSLSFC
jgi:hypothetical protein